jgi:hypothetical protein
LWADAGELDGVDAGLSWTGESDGSLVEVDVEDVRVDLLRDSVGVALVAPVEDGLSFCFEPTVATVEIGLSGGFEALGFLFEVGVGECFELLAVLVQLCLGFAAEQRLLLVEVVGDLLLEGAVVIDGRVAIGFAGPIGKDACPEFASYVEVVGLSARTKTVSLPDGAATGALHLIVSVEVLDEPVALTAPTADDGVSQLGVGASIALGGTSSFVVHQGADADLAR